MGGSRMTDSSRLDALYCSDPTCKYCNQLRELNAQLKKAQAAQRTVPIEILRGTHKGNPVEIEIETLKPAQQVRLDFKNNGAFLRAPGSSNVKRRRSHELK